MRKLSEKTQKNGRKGQHEKRKSFTSLSRESAVQATFFKNRREHV